MTGKIIKIIPLFISIAVCISACQQSPNKPIIVNKADGELERIIASSPAPLGKYPVIERWKDHVSSSTGKIELYIDAIIQTPDVDAYPVVRIIPADIPQSQADMFISLLMKGEPLYVPKGVDEYTKDELNKKIIELQRKINDSDSDLNRIKNSDPETYQEALKSYKQQIADYTARLKTAPEEYVRKSATGKFEKPSAENINSETAGEEWRELKNHIASLEIINVEANLGKSKPTSLYIFKNSSNKQNRLKFDNFDSKQRDTAFFEINDSLAGQKISLREAIDSAQEFLMDLGLSDYQPALIASRPYRSTEDKDRSIPLKDLPRFYEFFFTRTVDGIPTAYVDNRKFLRGTDKYSEDWLEELIKIDIDDTGILAWEWRSPASVVRTESVNVPLLPFSDIQEKFKQQIILSGSWVADKGELSRKLYINRITLGMARIQSINSTNEYLLVPAWDFFGYCVIKYKEGGGDKAYLNDNNEMIENTAGHSYLTINAIDGSIIYR